MLTIIRDPIEQAVSFYYYLGYAEWDRTYNPFFKNISLVEYAKNLSFRSVGKVSVDIVGRMIDGACCTCGSRFSISKSFMSLYFDVVIMFV
mmetsp:Transcript_54583/g.65816  ORF Transcript_54583/g.65816 Transcript_54583/m.65816 type:complete len:91 (+) Transcript_54583:664-936(+)